MTDWTHYPWIGFLKVNMWMYAPLLGAMAANCVVFQESISHRLMVGTSCEFLFLPLFSMINATVIAAIDPVAFFPFSLIRRCASLKVPFRWAARDCRAHLWRVPAAWVSWSFSSETLRWGWVTPAIRVMTEMTFWTVLSTVKGTTQSYRCLRKKFWHQICSFKFFFF